VSPHSVSTQCLHTVSPHSVHNVTDSTLLKTWLVTRKAESEKKLAEKEEKKERENNIWLLRDQEETREEVCERITLPISDTVDTVPIPHQENMEEPVPMELQSWMSGTQTETMMHEVQEHSLNSWLVKECQEDLSEQTDNVDRSHSNVPETKDIDHSNWIVKNEENNVSEVITSTEENNETVQEEEVKEEVPTENCWLFKYPKDENVTKHKDDIDNLVENCWLVPKQGDNEVTEELSVDNDEDDTSISASETNCWLLTYQDTKETDNSLAEDTDIAKENNETNPTESNIWLYKNEEVEPTFHDEGNETVELEAIIPEVEPKADVEVPTIEEITMIKEKMTFMSMWRKADPEEQSWDAVDDTAESEASIVTLDPSEDYDDFSDMQLELSQWISSL